MNEKTFGIVRSAIFVICGVLVVLGILIGKFAGNVAKKQTADLSIYEVETVAETDVVIAEEEVPLTSGNKGPSVVLPVILLVFIALAAYVKVGRELDRNKDSKRHYAFR